MQALYDASKGIAYARFYADYFKVPEQLRLFYYSKTEADCTNFVSQCVWAAYGGWIPGFDGKTVSVNKDRIKNHNYMVPFMWYGSPYYEGSNKWCRVMEFHDYSLSHKNQGPRAVHLFEGTWDSLKPALLREGDVIQLVVNSYAPYRYGHSLYVTEAGNSLFEVKVCCHSYDRLDAPLTEFSSFPLEYTKVRAMRFIDSFFVS